MMALRADGGFVDGAEAEKSSPSGNAAEDPFPAPAPAGRAQVQSCVSDQPLFADGRRTSLLPHHRRSRLGAERIMRDYSATRSRAKNRGDAFRRGVVLVGLSMR